MMSALDLVVAGSTAVAAGAVNALAGGGTLITFPTLLAVGLPAIEANVTNTVALCPGYLGASLAQLKDIGSGKKRLGLFSAAGAIGGVIGGLLLLHTGEKVFRALIPFLMLVASGLLAAQVPVRRWLVQRSERASAMQKTETWAVIPVGLAAVYGGYFGAGLSVIVLSVLGLMIDDSLTRLNAFKQIIAFSVNAAAAIFFLFSGRVVWSVAIVMAIGASIGGALGGRWASRVHPDVLRWVVVTIGTALAVVYFIR